MKSGEEDRGWGATSSVIGFTVGVGLLFIGLALAPTPSFLESFDSFVLVVLFAGSGAVLVLGSVWRGAKAYRRHGWILIGGSDDPALEQQLQHARRRLEEATERYEVLLQTSPDIVFVTDHESRMLVANEELERQTGLTVEDFQMKQEDNPFIHPEDRERIAGAIGQFLQSDRTISKPIENRFIDKNGDVHWYTSRIGKVTYEDEPALQFVARDITPRAIGDDQSNQHWYRSLLNRTQRLAGIGGYEFDLQAENLMWTDGMYELLEFETKEDPDPGEFLEYVHPDDRERIRQAFDAVIVERDSFDLDVKLVTEKGTLRWVRFQGNPLPPDSGEVKRLRGALVDITQRKEYEERLEELARTDPLTGLANYRTLRHELLDELERAERYAIDVSFAILDLDHFKRINDSHGHLVGDEILKQFADLLESETRAPDTVGRYGGEEFGLVLPETDVSGAERIVERVLEALRDMSLEVVDETLDLTASAGLTAHRPEDESTDELIKRADDALYRAKSDGRDQYQHA